MVQNSRGTENSKKTESEDMIDLKKLREVYDLLKATGVWDTIRNENTSNR